MRFPLVPCFVLALLIQIPCIIMANAQIASTSTMIDTDSAIANPPSAADFEEYGTLELFDLDSIIVNEDLTFSRVIHTAVLLTSFEGARTYGSRWINYSEGSDSVVIEIARTILPNGEIVDVPADQIFTGIIPSDLIKNDLYTDRRQIRVNFEGLLPGAVVELKWRQATYRLDFPGFYASCWLNGTEPVLFAAVVLDFPEGTSIYSKLHRLKISPTEQRDAGRVKKTWIVRSPELVVDEQLVRPYRDRYQIIEHSSFASWADFAKRIYDGLWLDELAKPLSEQELLYLSEITTDDTTGINRIAQVYDAVQRDVRYVGLELGVHNLKPHSSSVICEKRYGDCKDQSILLMKLLKKLGLDASVALVSSNKRTTLVDTAYAGYGCLDHAVVRVLDGTREYWLDPTLSAAPVDYIPHIIQGSLAITLASDFSMKTVPINPPEKDVVDSWFDLLLDSLGDARGTVSFHVTGPASVLGLKPQFRQMPPQQVRSAVASIFSTGQIDDYSISGLDDNKLPFGLTVDVVKPGFANRAGDLLIMSSSEPVSSKFDDIGKNRQRSSDVFFGRTFCEYFNLRLRLPDSYRLEHTPDPISFSCPYFDYFSICINEGDSVLIKSDSLIFKAYELPVADYQEYRRLTDSLDSVARTSVTLGKIE